MKIELNEIDVETINEALQIKIAQLEDEIEHFQYKICAIRKLIALLEKNDSNTLYDVDDLPF